MTNGYVADDVSKLLWILRSAARDTHWFIPQVHNHYLLRLMVFRSQTSWTLEQAFQLKEAHQRLYLKAHCTRCVTGRLGMFIPSSVSYIYQPSALGNHNPGKAAGWDKARKMEIGEKTFQLDVLDHCFTSSHGLIRIFRPRREQQWTSWRVVNHECRFVRVHFATVIMLSSVVICGSWQPITPYQITKRCQKNDTLIDCIRCMMTERFGLLRFAS